ncbi:PREDICTED: translation initiation factor IF-2-like [Ceratotherium simum simum]|uniref:Translation initiation factor IF-2-like n=1 Tax=Ceratotherium simum simum TaxID=73337 RepID=A0ABM1CV24_CERSS|nr:PREDICTED: translation initiation factor IF-2-like [Ceratotherium simum simum]
MDLLTSWSGRLSNPTWPERDKFRSSSLDGLPTATAIAAAAAAPAAPGRSPPTLAAAPAPARLPRGSLPAALCSRPTPARSQQHLLPPRRRPSRFIRATWPPAWKGPFASPGRGVSLRARAEAVGGRLVGGPSAGVHKLRPQGSPSPNVAVGPKGPSPVPPRRPQPAHWPLPPVPPRAGVRVKAWARRSQPRVAPRASRSGQLECLWRGGRDSGKTGPRGQHLAES